MGATRPKKPESARKFSRTRKSVTFSDFGTTWSLKPAKNPDGPQPPKTAKSFEQFRAFRAPPRPAQPAAPEATSFEHPPFIYKREISSTLPPFSPKLASDPEIPPQPRRVSSTFERPSPGPRFRTGNPKRPQNAAKGPRSPEKAICGSETQKSVNPRCWFLFRAIPSPELQKQILKG